MPTNITDTSSFVDPIQGPADADPQNAASYNLGIQGLADRTRNLKDRLDVTDAIVRPDLATSRGTYLHALQGASGWDGVDDVPGWVPTILGTSSQGTGAAPFHWGLMGGGVLPSLCTITEVRVFLKPGAARTTEADRTRVRVYRLPASGLVPVSIGDEYTDNTSTTQIVPVTGLSVTLSDGDSGVYGYTNIGLIVRVDPGNDASADTVYLCEVRYSTTQL